MLLHLLNLLGRSSHSMIGATGTTTLGFFVWVVAFAILSWAASIAARWVDLRRDGTTDAFRNALRASKLPNIFLFGFIFVMLLSLYEIFVVRTIYDDHEDLIAAVQALRRNNSGLIAEVEKRRNDIVRTDPVSSNINALLRAFDIYRHAIKGEPCVVMLTATPDSGPLVGEVSQFSNSVSDCFTVGPMSSGYDPEAGEQTTEGMQKGILIFHAAKDDKAALTLFDNLDSLIPMQRSYELPRYKNYQLPPNTGSPHLIWLQFGPNTKWSDRR